MVAVVSRGTVKSPARFLLAVLAALLALVVTVWAGALLYWHVRITSAIRLIETKHPRPGGGMGLSSDHSHATQVLHDAGCRALPYLVRRIDPSRHPEFLEELAGHVSVRVRDDDERIPAAPDPVESLLHDFPIRPEEAPARRERCDRIQKWWSDEGGRHHRWWRVWTDECVKLRR